MRYEVWGVQLLTTQAKRETLHTIERKKRREFRTANNWTLPRLPVDNRKKNENFADDQPFIVWNDLAHVLAPR